MSAPPTEERPEVSLEASSKSTAASDDNAIVSHEPSAAPAPTARIVSVTPYRHTRSVVVLCPICTRRHQHGLPWPDGDEPERIGRMHRATHCVGKLASFRGGYFIDPPSFPVSLDDVTTWGRPFPMSGDLAVAS
jgi:hypothetical protein